MNYARPTYTNGYDIRYNRDSDLFECWQYETLLTKKDKKPAAYKALGLAIKFMAACGAQVAQEKAKAVWIPPQAATIAPLEEQLAALATDAPRFVVIEKWYSAVYHEQGYAVYDRQAQEIVCPTTYRGRNFVTESREEAEKEAAYCLEHPPIYAEYDAEFAALLGDDDAIYEHQKAAKAMAPSPATKDVARKAVFHDGPFEVGHILTDDRLHRYRVTEKSYWLSEKDVAEIEEGFDIFNAQPGWHTKAELIEE